MCMIVKIDKLSHEMRGIAKIDNKVTFVDKVIPNEVVNIRITKQKKKINEAKLVSIIEKSPNRIEPKCKYYNICGGCNTEHISYNKSVIYKKEIVKNIFNKYCNMNIEPSIIYDADNTYNYRNKITLRIKDGKLSLVGDTLINIDYCYLVNNNINEVIKLLNSICLDGVNEVVIRGTDDIMVIIKGDINSSSIISILDGKVNSIFINNIKVYGNDHIIINVGNYSYAVYADSFFQVNTNMIDKLYNKVLEYAGTGNKLLDLYCGSGTIGIYLAHNFNTVIGIEQNKDAIKGANLNKKINNIHNISFICKQVSEINQIESDVVVVDPPRSGLDNTIMNKIMNSNIDKLVYVSCNPITLSRDINILKNKYNLVDITLYDMFPNTNHVETVVQLVRKKPDTYIDITVDMDELDLTSSEAKATYDEIKDYIFDKHSVKVSSLYIAQVKQNHGIIERDCYNNPKKDNPKQPQCPPEKAKLIEEALRYFKMIS